MDPPKRWIVGGEIGGGEIMSRGEEEPEPRLVKVSIGR